MDDLGFIPVWDPSPEEFERYKNREIELCKLNLQMLPKHNPMVLRLLTLHSDDTIREAIRSNVKG